MERGLDADGGPKPPHEMEYMVLARILVAQGRSDQAVRRLGGLLEGAYARGHTSRAIETLNLQALALQAQGAAEQAITALGRALSLAEPGGFVRTFVDEGPSMASLLYQAVACGITPDYGRRLLAAFAITEPDETASSQTAAPGPDLMEPLSEREREVLELLAIGLSNREIASRLFVSLNTVKAHTRSIYGKLGVHNRTQAVAMARTMGVLPFT
jgi:LuxR family maltose regulon positive regulatory protein